MAEFIHSSRAPAPSAGPRWLLFLAPVAVSFVFIVVASTILLNLGPGPVERRTAKPTARSLSEPQPQSVEQDEAFGAPAAEPPLRPEPTPPPPPEHRRRRGFSPVLDADEPPEDEAGEEGAAEDEPGSAEDEAEAAREQAEPDRRLNLMRRFGTPDGRPRIPFLRGPARAKAARRAARLQDDSAEDAEDGLGGSTGR